MKIFYRNAIPVRYFRAEPNVGDVLNPYLISKISGKKVYPMNSNATPHLIGIGSMLHVARSKSVVWGTGVIDPGLIPTGKTINRIEFKALRGKKTKDLLKSRGGRVSDLPLGDPAVLMPDFYWPKDEEKVFKIGIVPHYVDISIEAVREMSALPGATLIDVSLSPEQFVDKLVRCDFIVSSSLHGLILADSYGIPNIWARFSNNVTGGNFKFLDYYSTTNSKKASPLFFDSNSAEKFDIQKLRERADVKKFVLDKKELLDAFPFVNFC